MEFTNPPGSDPAPATRRIGGVGRAIATALLAGGLLVVGGAAAVSAASPDPSSSPSASQPSDDGSGSSGSERPDRTDADCPNEGTDGAEESNGSSS
jgi:hypothetical protein